MVKTISKYNAELIFKNFKLIKTEDILARAQTLSSPTFYIYQSLKRSHKGQCQTSPNVDVENNPVEAWINKRQLMNLYHTDKVSGWLDGRKDGQSLN